MSIKEVALTIYINETPHYNELKSSQFSILYKENCYDIGLFISHFII